MANSTEWHITDRYGKPDGTGCVVERNGHLGYAKMDGQREKLGADLAKLIGAAVPTVEIGTVNQQRVFVSHIHSEKSQQLARNDQGTRTYSEDEKSALKAASSLLPFFAWIGDTDRNDDTNLVLEQEPRRIVGIDFELAFNWRDSENDIVLPMSPGLVANMDSVLVEEAVTAIEQLTTDQITSCCIDSGYSESVAKRIATVLDGRKSLLRAELKKVGWIR